MSGERWLCHDCGHRFNDPGFNVVEEAIHPSIKLGERIQYKCPKCESTNLAGSANPEPSKPIICRIDRRNR